MATDEPERVIARALDAGVNVSEVGEAGGEEFASESLFSIPLARLRARHEGWLPALMGADVEGTA